MQKKTGFVFFPQNKPAGILTGWFYLFDILEFGGESSLTIRARCGAFRYFPNSLGIVPAKQLDKLEFSSLLFLFEIRNGNQNNYDDRQCKEQE